MKSFSSGTIDSRINLVTSLPVISGYYLVLGGGKIGDSFLRYAKRSRFPLVLVIDSDADAPASLNAVVLDKREEVVEIIRSVAAAKANTGRAGEGDAGTGNGDTRGSGDAGIYFYRMDVSDVFSLLACGIPEFVIPAVPSHAAADIVEASMDLGKGGLARKLSINRDDEVLASFFQGLVSAFPENVIAGTYPEHGAIFLSYAQPGETCPDNCPGQEDYCRTFSREKPRTITSYAMEATLTHPGQVFNSYQMKPGIGGIKGVHLKENMISAMRYVRSVMENPLEHPLLRERSFFIATTCNCHGILTLLYVV
ncbi:hypothetical protein [Methanolobus chelungpuianus]|uniref:Uncharacterized protein n=1 Tax=Methanolobus chelungpuianus TaxID=502115 RepID=A0AAE3HAH9_9EURY|nr:hypothetical protein [Methanolobus chelungpuianus]MCQ6962203.1 hypothetical protein [Methanolobus chelungpuianus]